MEGLTKFQKLWRAKRVFTNNQGAWKLSSSKITTQVVTFKVDVDFGAFFQNTPKGFSEIIGFKTTSKNTKLRWTPGTGWIGDLEGITKFTIKKGQHTIVLTSSSIDILGPGPYEPALLSCVKSGLVPKSILREKPTYKNINGIFYVNKPFMLKDLSEELRHIPSSMREKIIPYTAEAGVPAVVLKLKDPKWTYQFFQNGTVLFAGIKNPNERDEPRKLFKKFFTEYGVTPFLVMNLGKNAAIGKPVAKNAGAKKAALANRNPLAGTWNALKKPPQGFYIRPGTNGKPRFYMWHKMEQNKTTKEWKAMGPMNLTAVAPKVVKAFKNAGRNIPQSTINAFESAGFPLTSMSEKVGNNRRAQSWNATKPGFYVRPGPGQQPYWFKVPSGLASGRKTVIATYKKAGRNIPASVRAIFKIAENVKTNANTGAKHTIVMGLNGMIRINGRQASRLTKAQLIAVARNMNIPQANESMNPARIAKLIQNKAGVKNAGNRAYNVKLNEVYYRFMNNGRVEKTQANKKGFAQRTTRNWSTIPIANQNKIAKAFLPATYHESYNVQPKNKKYASILIYKNSLKPVTPSPSSRASSSNSNLGSLANFGAELEANMKNQEHRNAYKVLVGNYYRNENANKLMVRLSKLPVGAKKANVTRAIKTFAKEAVVGARRNLIEANYKSKITVPNWLPNNIKNSYRTALLGAALQTNNKGKYPSQKAIKAAMQSWVNQHVPKSGKAAYNKENVITGVVTHVPAWNPPKNPRINVPKRLSPPRPTKPKAAPKAAPKKKSAPVKGKKYRLNENSNNANNIGSALISLGLNTKNAYTWNNLVHAGINKKYKNAWARQLSA
jgi:hypothetical protein